MYKPICYIVLLLLMLNVVLAEEYSYPAGEVFSLYNIPDCEGPVFIKMTSTEGVNEDDMQIEKCVQTSPKLWECKCVNSFNVVIKTKEDLVKTYDVLIQYFLEYDDIPETVNGTPSIDYITQYNNIRSHSMLNVKIEPFDKPGIPFVFDVEAKNAIIVGVLVFVGIIMFLIIRYRDNYSKSNHGNGGNDVLNYKIEKEEDIQDILDMIE